MYSLETNDSFFIKEVKRPVIILNNSSDKNTLEEIKPHSIIEKKIKNNSQQALTSTLYNSYSFFAQPAGLNIENSTPLMTTAIIEKLSACFNDKKTSEAEFIKSYQNHLFYFTEILPHSNKLPSQFDNNFNYNISDSFNENILKIVHDLYSLIDSLNLIYKKSLFKSLINQTRKKYYNFPVSDDAFESLFSLYDANNFYLPIKAQQAMEEIISILVSPNILDQTNRNTCGVAVYMQFLTSEYPDKFIALALNLLKYGQSDIPFSIKINASDIESENKLIPAMLSAIRHTENILGYKPTHFMEAFLGLTLPKEIAKWVELSGGHIEEECMKIVDSKFQEMHPLARTILGLGDFYSTKHQYDTSADKLLSNLIKAIDSKNFCVILLSNPLCNFLSKILEFNNIEQANIKTMLGAQIGHYVRLLNIEKTEASLVKLKISTWGKIYNLDLPIEIFSKHILGCLNIKKRELNHKNTISNPVNNYSF